MWRICLFAGQHLHPDCGKSISLGLRYCADSGILSIDQHLHDGPLFRCLRFGQLIRCNWSSENNAAFSYCFPSIFFKASLFDLRINKTEIVTSKSFARRASIWAWSLSTMPLRTRLYGSSLELLLMAASWLVTSTWWSLSGPNHALGPAVITCPLSQLVLLPYRWLVTMLETGMTCRFGLPSHVSPFSSSSSFVQYLTDGYMQRFIK